MTDNSVGRYGMDCDGVDRYWVAEEGTIVLGALIGIGMASVAGRAGWRGTQGARSKVWRVARRVTPGHRRAA